MNILIDMRPFYTPAMNRGGVYSNDLLRALFRNHPNDIFYLWTTGKKRPKKLPNFEKYSHVKYVHTKISDTKLQFWIQSFSYPYIDDIVETQAMKEGLMAWSSQIDAAIFLAPTIAPIERNCLKVYLCESLSPLHYPSAYSSDTKKIHCVKNYKHCFQTADLLVTPSGFLKDDILKTFPKYAENKKITVIGAGVVDEFSQEKDQVEEENILEKELFLQHEEDEKEDITEKLPKNFFFVRGIESQFGNFPPFLQAYTLFQSRFGKEAWNIVIEEVREGDLSEQCAEKNNAINFLPPLTAQERVDVLKKAKCFVYPSQYDGDGIAIIEAMRQNCPLISSNFAALPEVFRETAIDFDPTSYLSILRAIKKFFRDTNLSETLSPLAQERSYHSRFRWDDIAEHLMHRITERIEEKAEEEDE